MVDVTVGNTFADTKLRNYAVIPKEVSKKVARAKVRVGNMTASIGSVNRVGIF